jgi:hypothetical protein
MLESRQRWKDEVCKRAQPTDWDAIKERELVLKEKFEERRAEFDERFKKKQDEITEKQVRFAPSFQNTKMLKRVQSMS